MSLKTERDRHQKVSSGQSKYARKKAYLAHLGLWGFQVQDKSPWGGTNGPTRTEPLFPLTQSERRHQQKPPRFTQAALFRSCGQTRVEQYRYSFRVEEMSWAP